VVILTPQTMTDIEEVAKVIVDVSAAYDKPVLASFMGLVDVTPGVEILRKNGIPHYPFPEGAAQAMRTMYQYASWVSRPRTEERIFEVDRREVAGILKRALDEGRTRLPDLEALGVLKAYGIPVLPSRLARSCEEVVEICDEIGFPIVMKIASPDILHKTDVQGVVVGIETRDTVRPFPI